MSKQNQTAHWAEKPNEQVNVSISNDGERQLLQHIFENSFDEPVCTCDHFAPMKHHLTSTTFLSGLGKFYLDLNLPASQTLYWALDQIYRFSSGTLHDLDDKPIGLFETFKVEGFEEFETDSEDDKLTEIDIVDWAFGKDFARSMRRIMDRAHGEYKNHMKMTPQMVMRILLLHCARQIHTCRTVGKCSKH